MMASNCLQLHRRAATRSAAARLAQRNNWTQAGTQPPIDLLMRTDRMAAIKTSYVPGHLAGLSMLWPQELKDVVTSAGLHGTMYIRSMNNIDRQHGLWLLNNLDPVTLEMRFRDGELRTLDRPAAVEILGLNGGGREVPVVNPSEREVLVGRVLRLLGEDEKRQGGLSVKMLKEFLEKPPPLNLTAEYKRKVKISYTLLAMACFIAPRFSNPTITEEAMYIVLFPDEIGEYDLASYALQVLREAAHRARVDQSEGSMTILAGGCLGLLEVFSFDCLQIPEVEETKYVSPRIAAFNGSFLRELIKKECYETGEGKIYGRAPTIPLRRSPTLQLGGGSSRGMGAGSSHIDRSLLSTFEGRVPTMHDFVAMVMADQNSRVSEMYERVCHEYRMIDEQVEVDRKRRRNEVNIAAGNVDLDQTRRLTAKYTELVEKILAAGGVIPMHGGPIADQMVLDGVGEAPPCTPVHGFVINDHIALSLGANTSGQLPGGASGGGQHQGGLALLLGSGLGSSSTHERGGLNTVAGAAEILESMNADRKGKGPILGETSKATKLPVRRLGYNSSGGVGMPEAPRTLGMAVDTVPIWDVSGGYSGGMRFEHEPAGDNGDMELAFMDEEGLPDSRFSLHPSLLGLGHAPYQDYWVDGFYDSTTYFSPDELQGRWYVSMDREEHGWSVILTGQDLKDQMADETEITFHLMAASNRDTNLKDRLMYCNEQFPWGCLVEPDWAIHFLYDPERTSVEYIDELMSPRRIGYDISMTRMIMSTVHLRDAWSLYGFDMMEKVIHVLDPLYQGADEAAYQSKHADACKCLLTGLRRCGERHGYGWNVVESEWRILNHNTMHPRCTHENTGVYVYLYATKFNGVTVPGLEGGLTPRQVSHLRRKMVFEVSNSRANTGEIPGYLIQNGW